MAWARRGQANLMLPTVRERQKRESNTRRSPKPTGCVPLGDTPCRLSLLHARERHGRPDRILDHGGLLLRTAEHRLPGRQVLEPVEVAARDCGQLPLGDPAEDVVSIQKLEAVEASAAHSGSSEEASRHPACRQRALERVRMSADERRSRRASLPERFVEPVVDPDELAQTDSDGMARPPRILVLHGQLDPGDENEPELVTARSASASISARWAPKFSARTWRPSALLTTWSVTARTSKPACP